jgi:hypothetical protein
MAATVSLPTQHEFRRIFSDDSVGFAYVTPAHGLFVAREPVL